MARAAGVGIVMGYGGGWRQPVTLEAEYPRVDHWNELRVAERWEPAHGVSMETRAPRIGA